MALSYIYASACRQRALLLAEVAICARRQHCHSTLQNHRAHNHMLTCRCACKVPFFASVIILSTGFRIALALTYTDNKQNILQAQSAVVMPHKRTVRKELMHSKLLSGFLTRIPWLF